MSSEWLAFIERVGVPASVSLALLWMHHRSLRDIAKTQESISKSVEHILIHLIGKQDGKND